MPDPLGPITAGRRGAGLVSFPVGPIPVTIHLSFLIVLVFLGIDLGQPVLIATWVATGVASILLHELGHAVAAVLAGYEPTVDLAGMGGVTSYTADRDRGRLWAVTITAAGPVVQLVAGLAVLPLLPDGFGLSLSGGLVGFALSAWVYVSVLWGGLNLVPILPLDGGQLFRNLLPGAPDRRTRIAEVVSVVLAAGGLAWGLLGGQTIAALLAAWFGFANLQSLMASRKPPAGTSSRPPSGAAGLLGAAQEAMRDGDPDRAAELAGRAAQQADDRRVATVAASQSLAALLQAGRSRDAYRLAADPRHGLACQEVLVGHALARHPDRARVWAVLVSAGRTDSGARLRGIAAVVAAAHGRATVADQVMASGAVSDVVRAEVDRLASR